MFYMEQFQWNRLLKSTSYCCNNDLTFYLVPGSVASETGPQSKGVGKKKRYHSRSECCAAPRKYLSLKMARIAVLDHNQLVTDKPRIFRKSSICKKLVRHGVAAWIVKGTLLRLLAPDEVRRNSEQASVLMKAAQVLRNPWESPELPGLIFQPPNIRHNPDAAILRMSGNSKASRLGIEDSEIDEPISQQDRERMFAEFAAAI